MKKYNVAILGATGAVGQEFLNLIEERNFPFNELKLLASHRSAGKKFQLMILLKILILLFLLAVLQVKHLLHLL